MNRISGRARMLYLLVAFFCAGVLFLTATLGGYAKTWAVHPGNQNLYTGGKLTAAGAVYDRNGTVLAQTSDGQRRFADSAGVRKATLHAVGDLHGFISTGVQTAFRTQLAGFDIINGTFTVGGVGNDITMTIDARLSEAALSALGSKKGAVGVMNYKTGEILAMVSAPTYDPNSPPSAKQLESDKYKGIYVNRVLSGQFAPGSIFKLVTAAAAIDNIDDIFEKEYVCKGGVEIGGETLTCAGYHGKVNFRKALNVSCNAAFAQIALELGQDTMLKYTKKLGFGGTYRIDGLKLSAGKYPLDGARDIDFGWSAIGQHNDTVNPMHYLMFICAIANGGVVETPHFIDSIKTGYGLTQYIRTGGDERLLPEATADTLKGMMRSNVTENYGDGKFPGLRLCAKSGTAEILKNDVPHSWFVGFLDDEEYPFAFVAVAENSGAGIGVAATVANKVMQKAKDLF